MRSLTIIFALLALFGFAVGAYGGALFAVVTALFSYLSERHQTALYEKQATDPVNAKKPVSDAVVLLEAKECECGRTHL